MKPGTKYLLILMSVCAVGLGLLIFLGDSEPNVEVVVLNKSDQSVESIHLETEKSAKNIVLRGVDVGAQVTVKFHNDGADTFTLVVRFTAGKEVRGEPFYFEPGQRVVATFTEEEIRTEIENSRVPAR
jgi:hypothetical protein